MVFTYKLLVLDGNDIKLNFCLRLKSSIKCCSSVLALSQLLLQKGWLNWSNGYITTYLSILGVARLKFVA